MDTGFFDRAGRDAPAPRPVQRLDRAVRNILFGLGEEQAVIYPNGAYPVFSAVNRVFPPAGDLYLRSEKKRFDRWLSRHDAKKDGRA